MRSKATIPAYKKANENIKKGLNEKGKEIVKKSFEIIIDRMGVNAESNRFITIKEYKENFLNHLKIRLINPGTNEIGKISKKILYNVI